VDSVFVSDAADTTIVIQNTGASDLDLNVAGITLALGSGTETGTFSLVTSPSATLASGAKTTLTLRFVPASVGAKTATISIPSNDIKTPVFTFTMNGTGFTMTLSTVSVTVVTYASATSGGAITSDGGSPITARGICWSTLPNPTIAAASQADVGTGTGSFACALSDLLPGTYYYVRAWATNAMGTGYALSVGFTTTAATAPTTTAPSAINATTATAGGTAIADTGVVISARGVCWNTAGNPTIADAHTADGSGPGSFVSGMTGLAVATTYYVRAYATNQGNTVYGNQVSLKTVGYTDSKGYYVFYDAGSVQTDATSGDWRYMEAAPSDMGPSNWSKTDSALIGTGQELGTGKANTFNIVAALGLNSVSALACFQATFGGYNDWFLPSFKELYLMIVNLANQGLGGFNNSHFYWSSTEADRYKIYYQGTTSLSNTTDYNFYYQLKVLCITGLTRATRRVTTLP
jgi:hypothetical protein